MMDVKELDELEEVISRLERANLPELTLQLVAEVLELRERCATAERYADSCLAVEYTHGTPAADTLVDDLVQWEAARDAYVSARDARKAKKGG